LKSTKGESVKDSGFYDDSFKEGFHSPTPQTNRKKKAKAFSGIGGCHFSFVGIILYYLLSSPHSYLFPMLLISTNIYIKKLSFK